MELIVSQNSLPDRPEKSRILIVDDHPLVREGLRGRITAQSDLKVCGEADDLLTALAAVKATLPDLVVVDLSLKGSHGLDLIKEIKARHSDIKILVVSAYEESLFGERALRAGALGYVNKQEVQSHVIDAIRAVLAGRRYLSPDLLDRLVGQAVGATSNCVTDPIAALSDRELEVFQLIGQGYTTGAIAAQLHRSVHTIDSHREKIKRKLNLRSGTELTQHAVQWVLEHN
jgi:DNA-binding NarL/FixJ family response regulator